jgi:hypothetical protein
MVSASTDGSNVDSLGMMAACTHGAGGRAGRREAVGVGEGVAAGGARLGVRARGGAPAPAGPRRAPSAMALLKPTSKKPRSANDTTRSRIWVGDSWPAAAPAERASVVRVVESLTLFGGVGGGGRGGGQVAAGRNRRAARPRHAPRRGRGTGQLRPRPHSGAACAQSGRAALRCGVVRARAAPHARPPPRAPPAAPRPRRRARRPPPRRWRPRRSCAARGARPPPSRARRRAAPPPPTPPAPPGTAAPRRPRRHHRGARAAGGAAPAAAPPGPGHGGGGGGGHRAHRARRRRRATRRRATPRRAAAAAPPRRARRARRRRRRPQRRRTRCRRPPAPGRAAAGRRAPGWPSLRAVSGPGSGVRSRPAAPWSGSGAGWGRCRRRRAAGGLSSGPAGGWGGAGGRGEGTIGEGGGLGAIALRSPL